MNQSEKNRSKPTLVLLCLLRLSILAMVICLFVSASAFSSTGLFISTISVNVGILFSSPMCLHCKRVIQRNRYRLQKAPDPNARTWNKFIRYTYMYLFLHAYWRQWKLRIGMISEFPSITRESQIIVIGLPQLLLNIITSAMINP